MSQLSKKFPISDVIEKSTIRELDEELAWHIQARLIPTKSNQMIKRYFSSASVNDHTVVSPIVPKDESKVPDYSRNGCELLNTLSSSKLKDPIITAAGNANIFGKLKYREQRIPSTALENSRVNRSSFIQEKRKPVQMPPYPFISPQKMVFFKSHYPKTAFNEEQPLSSGNFEVASFGGNAAHHPSGFDMGLYTGTAGQAYFQPSFNGLEP